MRAAKSNWSFLVVEDNASLRELIKGNFAALLGGQVRVDFAASICHAIARTKWQMLRGDPYDVFWIDLYLDYFSYDDTRGEIISAGSLSQIIDTNAFLKHYGLRELRLPALIGLLQIPVTPPHKSGTHYTDWEKFLVLQKFAPHCLPNARESFLALLELAEFYLSRQQKKETVPVENVYVHHALDFIFQRLLQWMNSSKEREVAIREAELDDWPPPNQWDFLPDAKAKSDQSWTLLRGWIEHFYHAVALGATGYEKYQQSHKRLHALQQHRPSGYPLFLVNTAYPSRRENLLQTASVWAEENLLIAPSDFKGSRRDRELVEYLADLLQLCRRPYFFLRRHHRSGGMFVIADEIAPAAALLAQGQHQPAVKISDPELGIDFQLPAFFPDLVAAWDQVEGATEDWQRNLRETALREVEDSLQQRRPGMIHHFHLYIPHHFFEADSKHGQFLLRLPVAGSPPEHVPLSFDEGRWLLLELVCRRWFPKCFFMHSSWTILHHRANRSVYFYSTTELLERALKRAALDQPDLFPPAAQSRQLASSLQPTKAFYQPHSPYADAFNWQELDEQIQLTARPASAHPPALVRARQRLTLTQYLLQELHIRAIASQLLKTRPITVTALPDLLMNSAFPRLEEELGKYQRLLAPGNENSRRVAGELLPKLDNLLSVLLCFYSIPDADLQRFYHFWESKLVPDASTSPRPTEKFSNISRKLQNAQFTRSVPLPAKAAGKNKYLFVTATFESGESRLLLTNPPTGHHSHQPPFIDLTALNFPELLHHLPAPVL
ncbi:MAG: hypothetical protein ONB48_18250 [candidate division KSB1 bacterium]|nr:hypothetical protein [candidate division KSB1 bacterium]MDZ7275837.1 hypothetical protein [candidate division KSB1 bacterium]MDZ7287587.1 hypothetical protein [candidate division KSB1 bacterium]MDZ7306509.1 hypothetical protein [candidate division KSB1 bacterium]MDZ7350565.1 hypothetical protein [candidate division KSB1 bacterium]